MKIVKTISIPTDKFLNPEELQTAIEDGVVQFADVMLSYISAVPSVHFVLGNDVRIAISPSAQMMLDPLNPDNFQFPVSVRMLELPDTPAPTEKFLVNAVNLLINSGLVDFSVFSTGGQFPVAKCYFDLKSWSPENPTPTETGEIRYCLFGWIDFPAPTRQMLLEHASHTMMVGSRLAEHIDSGVIASRKDNVATAIMTGNLNKPH